MAKQTAPTGGGSGTGGITSLASSSTWEAGYEWFVMDFSTNNPLWVPVWGKITSGTTPTANTEIRIYLIAIEDGTNYPDVFDGNPSAETVTSAGCRDSYAKLAHVIRVDSATSDRGYDYKFEVRQVLGYIPKKAAVFITHNTGAGLNGTAGNQTYNWTEIWTQ